jgi:hypothetical protein
VLAGLVGGSRGGWGVQSLAKLVVSRPPKCAAGRPWLGESRGLIDPGIGSRFACEAEGRLDEAAAAHNGNVEADTVGMWGESVSCHAPYMARHKRGYITERRMGLAGHRRGRA